MTSSRFLHCVRDKVVTMNNQHIKDEEADTAGYNIQEEEVSERGT